MHRPPARLLAHVDAIRLTISADLRLPGTYRLGAPTAQSGQWVPGPGAEFFNAVQRELGGLPFIAEDLGLITPDVCALRDQFRVPGTRVLQFAFDGHADNPHLPENYVPNTVVYPGTHDNPTTREWYEELPDAQRRVLWSYLEATRGPKQRCGTGVDAASVVIGGRARDRSAAGCAQPWDRGSDEHARSSRGQLVLALPRSHAVCAGDPMAAELDEDFKSLWRIASPTSADGNRNRASWLTGSFGAAILRDARANGLITCAPAEKSGQEEFQFEYGDRYAEHIAASSQPPSRFWCATTPKVTRR